MDSAAQRPINSLRLRNQEHTRQAVVYQVADGHPAAGLWRIRVERHPEYTEAGSGWFGGKVLFGHDMRTLRQAESLAEDWVCSGILPAN